ncbi:RCC1 repeat-containing protein [Gammaproteobacteria bacterium]
MAAPIPSQPRPLGLFILIFLLSVLAAAEAANPPQVAMGADHSLARKPDGTLIAWGRDGMGQLGVGRALWLARPQLIQGVQGIELGFPPVIAAGSFHALARRANGTLWSWGNNGNGQLGDGTTGDRSNPASIQGLADITTVSAGVWHSLAVKSGDTVWAWGYNGSGGLGDGTTQDRARPVLVAHLTGVIAVSAGQSHSLALKSDGTVWAWGANHQGQLGQGAADTDPHTVPRPVANLTQVKAVATRQNHNLALLENGTVWAWGDNALGQLGDGTTTDRYAPVLVSGLGDVTAVAAGSYHSLALKNDGTVWAWGNNAAGQLGDGSTTKQSRPLQVAGLDGVKAVAAGSQYSLVLKSDGTVWAWGANNYAQLGQDTHDESAHTTPAQVLALSNVTALAAGEAFSLAARQDGTLWGWGSSGNGQLGATSPLTRSVPNPVFNIKDVLKMATSWSFNLVVTQDGSVWAWGENHAGQLGDGTRVNRSIPLQVPGLTGVVSVAAGSAHSLALGENGRVWIWGENSHGQLGNDSATGQSIATPQGIPLADVTVVAAGGDHSLALKSDGTVWGWGFNADGEVGDGSRSQRNSPVQVKGLPRIIAIAAGRHHSLALDQDFALWAWGRNEWGQIGDGTTNNQLSPVRVLNQVMAIAAGSYHSLVVKSDSTAWAWGDNENGQLGLGGADALAHSTPAPVVGLSKVVTVAGGRKSSLAVLQNGSVWAFGDNDSGQLGDGTYARHVRPVLAVSETLQNVLVIELPKADIPPEDLPCFLTHTSTCGNLVARSLEVNIYGLLGIEGVGMPKPAQGERSTILQGFCGEIDAVGMPKPAFGEMSVFRPICPIDATGMPKPNSRESPQVINLYVAYLTPSGAWFQLDDHRAWIPLTQPMTAYRTNVNLYQADQKVYTAIFENADLTGLVGARLFVGYGRDSDEMIRARRYREILTLVDP